MHRPSMAKVQVHQAWPIPMTERVAAESPLDRLQLDQQGRGSSSVITATAALRKSG